MTIAIAPALILLALVSVALLLSPLVTRLDPIDMRPLEVPLQARLVGSAVQKTTEER